MRKIMVVDDEQLFLKMVKFVLESKGYKVLTLSDATNILSFIHSFGPDIILLDIIMPMITGSEVCSLLKKDPQTNNIPIIIISALEDEANKLKEENTQVVDCLIKPIKVETLIKKIEEILN